MGGTTSYTVGDNLAVKISQGIAEKEGVDPVDLPPLYDVADLRSLEKLLESAHESMTVQFTYCDYTVVVGGDGDVQILDSPPTESPQAHAEEHQVS